MARVHIRIVAALIALAVLAVAVLGAVYVYEKKFVPEKALKEKVQTLMKSKTRQADPGLRVYEQGMALLRRREMEAAKEKLTEVTEIYHDSSRCAAARAVLGEMNMDRLFSQEPMPGKLEYPVGKTKQDNLNAISVRFRTTVGYIKRVNNLLGTVIRPGDRLVLYPLDFEIEVYLHEKRLTLIKDGRFFKDYTIVGHHLPFTKLSKQTSVTEVPGWILDKRIRPDDDRYTEARKWIQTAGRGSRAGVIFCPEPPAPPAGSPLSPAGIYLSAADMHELSTVVRPGIPLRFIEPGKS